MRARIDASDIPRSRISRSTCVAIVAETDFTGRVVFEGLRPSTAYRGLVRFTDAGGRSVGILPGDSRLDANPYLTVAVATGMGEARNAIVVRTADVVIAVRGEFGTLSEIALALKIGKPVVGIGTWEFGKEGERVDAIVRATDPRDAVAQALRLAGR